MTAPLDEKRALHVRRVRESFEKIPELRKTPGVSRTQGFDNWRDRTKHSLVEVFGRDHEYVRRFGRLDFRVPRMVFGKGPPAWTPEDEKACSTDLYAAEQLLKDALDEADKLPAPRADVPAPVAPDSPPIVIQILNQISQEVSVDVRQLVASIEAMPLDSATKQAAEEQVRLLEQEARGPQRWSVMGKSLDMLKGFGKGIYEKVALPLLLEIIKRQTLGPP
jgi:hypothetical protein